MEKTPEQWMAELNAEEGQSSGRKLKFREQCAAFACLYGGVKPQIVARAFSVSGPTISHIGGCLEQDPNPTRRRLVFNRGGVEEVTEDRDHNRIRYPGRARYYETVAREFEALGVEEFNRRYLTADIRERLNEARASLRAERREHTGLFKPLTREERLYRMSTKEINAYYAEHPDEDPRNHDHEEN